MAINDGDEGDNDDDDDDEDNEGPAGSVDDVGHPQLSHVGNCLHLDGKYVPFEMLSRATNI